MVGAARARIGIAVALLLAPLVVVVGPFGGGGTLSAAPGFERITSAPPAVASLRFHRPYISGDGRFVLYRQLITDNLEAGFVHDRNGAQSFGQEVIAYPPNQLGATITPILSRDGCHVAYWLRSSGTTSEPWVAWVWDRCIAGAVPEATPIHTWTTPNRDFDDLAISADGRYLAAAVHPDQTTALLTVARYDRAAGPQDGLRRMPHMVFTPCPAGVLCDLSYSSDVDISDDGSYVAATLFADSEFEEPSSASAVAGWRIADNATELLSFSPQGTIAFDDSSWAPSLSADGRYVGFITEGQAFVRDRATGQTRMLTDTPGTPMPGSAWDLDLTPDGSQAALEYAEDCDCNSQAVVAYPTNGTDPVTHYETISVGTQGNASEGGFEAVISATGRYVAFASGSDTEFGYPDELDVVPGSDQGSGPLPEGDREDVWLEERPPSLTLTPPIVDFGVVEAGQSSAVVPATVTNTSPVVVPISTVSPLTPPFFVESDGCTGVSLQPQASCVIGVQYRPTSPSSSTGTLVVTGEGVTVASPIQGTGRQQPVTTPTTSRPTTTPRPTVTRRPNVTTTTTTTTTTAPGRAALTIGPATLDFGATTVGQTVGPQTLTVTNTGTVGAAITSGVIAGSGGDQFTGVANTCSGRTLAPRATCTITIQASPTRAGPSDGTFTVGASGGIFAVATLRVSATFAPTLLVKPGVLRPGVVARVVGAGFPPNTPIQLTLARGGPLGTPTSDASGAFSFTFMVFRNDPRIGGQALTAVDQPGLFAGVRATFLIELATFAPGASANSAITNGVRPLVNRNG